MSTALTSRRWVGRIVAIGAVTVTGAGLGPGLAVASEPVAVSQPLASAQPVPAVALAQVVDPEDAASVRGSWEARGRPDRMVVVRDARIDLVTRAGSPTRSATAAARSPWPIWTGPCPRPG
jgi:hypothetical protein